MTARPGPIGSPAAPADPERDRALHESAVATLRGWTAPDPDQDAVRAEYLKLLLGDRPCLRKPDLPDHLTAGAVLLSADGAQVLLNLHRKARRWFHFGGHLEPEDGSLLAGARREVIEESGVTDVFVDPDPVHLSIHPVPFCSQVPGVRHFDVRYAARTSPGAVPEISEESLDVRWFDVEDLPTDEPELLALIRLARERLF